MPKSETQITFRLPRDLYVRLTRAARETEQSQANLLREAAEAYLTALENRNQERPADRVRDLIGAISSGRRDLGTEHSRHLKRILRGR